MATENTAAEARRCLRVKFLDGGPDLEVEVKSSETIDGLMAEIRRRKGWATESRVRVIAGGKEQFPEGKVENVHCDVLHCVLCENKPGSGAGKCLPGRARPQTDWLDVIDPGVLLKWILGMMLTIFWILFFYCGSHFDTASIAMLAVLTTAFVVPCAANHWSWPQSWQVNVHNSAQELLVGVSNSISYDNADLHRLPLQSIPPRPQAPIQGAGVGK